MEYTKATLQAAIRAYAEDDDPEFIAELDQIVRRGEDRLYRMLDLGNLDSVNLSATSASSEVVSKPANLVVDRLLMVNDGNRWRPILRRSRAWVEMYNADGEEGPPLYYTDNDETQWLIAPIALDVYDIKVHGWYSPASIMDGISDDAVTWASSRLGDLLALACSVEAYEFLKAWAHKASAEAELSEKVKGQLGIMASLSRADAEDIVQGQVAMNPPPTQQLE